MPSYILSEPYKQRVDRALSVVEGQPSQGNLTTIPTRFETLPQSGSPNPLELAAYPRDLAWKKGSTAEVILYTQSGSSYGPAMETLSDGSQIPRTMSVTNVANDFDVPNLYGTSEDVGPTPTMTWCVVGKPRRGDQYVAIEGPVAPVRLATVTTEQIGNQWAKGTAKTVEITATGQTVEVYSVLDAHTKLDFPNGLVYTKSVDPNDPTRTANVVISPPAIPLHEARFSEGNIDEEWPRGDTKQLLVTRADGEEVQVPVENTFFDAFKPGTAALAIGRFGTTFSVITGPQGSGEVTPGTLVSPIAPNEQWDAGSIRPVRITGTTTEVDVVNVFEELTPLDGHRGVLFAKSEKDPLGGEGTANILIAPAPKELFEARFSQGNVDEEWATGQTKDLIVPAGAGRSEDIIVPVANRFFDTFKPGTAALAIGKIDGEFCVLTAPQGSGEVTPGTLVSPIAPNEQWDAGSIRPVRITGTTTEVDVVNVFEELTPLDGHRGVLFAKSEKDPLGGEGTANILIAPAPKELFEARFSQGNIDEEWATGQTKDLIVPAGAGRSEDIIVPVANRFFDTFKPGTAALAIGKIDGEFCVLTGPQGSGEVTPGTLVSPIAPNEQWDAGSIRPVRITGTTTEVDVVNVFEELTPLDGHRGVLFAKSEKDPLGGEGTANILIAPAPKELFEARFSQGNVDEEWATGQTKDLIVPAGAGRSEDIIVPVANRFFDTFKPGTAALAIGKIDGEFCVLTAPQGSGEVTPGTLVSPIAPNEQWDAGSIRPVRITGTTTEVDVVNVFEELTPLDGHRGVLFAKSEKDPLGGEGTANILIAPAPKELFEARFSQGNIDEEWATGQTKDLIVPAGGGRSEDIIVPVANKFFDTFKPGTAALAIGKIDGEFCVLTNNNRSGDVLLANRTDENEWPRGSERDVQVHGESRTISAINLTGDYEAWDAKDQQQGPNLLAVRGSGLGAAGGTQWYVVAPPPKMFDLGTWDGEWESGSEKQFYLDSNGESVQASNTLFDLPGGGSGAVVKVDGAWKLVSVQLETETATKVDGVQEMPYVASSVPVTVVTDVEVSGEIKQSAASPVTIGVTPVLQQYAFVSGVQVGGELSQSSGADPVLVYTTAQTSSITVLEAVSVTASLDSSTCSITAGVTPTTRDVTVVTGVSGEAELDLSKLSIEVSSTITTSSVSLVTGVQVSHEFDVSKLFVELNKTLTTAVVQAVGATTVGKFVQTTATFTYLRFPGTVQ